MIWKAKERIAEPACVHSARELLAGRLHVHGQVTLSFDEIHTCWQHLLLRPDDEVDGFEDPGRRNCLYDVGGLSTAEEEAVNEAELGDLGRDVARRIYLSAIQECHGTLFHLSSDRTLRGYRMVARMCDALREELRTLIQEWDDLGLDIA